MTDEPAPRRRRWISSLVILVVTSTILTLGLEAASFIGAKDFVDGVTSNTSDALRKLTPLEMAKRYDATYRNLGSGACRDAPFSQFGNVSRLIRIQRAGTSCCFLCAPFFPWSANFLASRRLTRLST